MKNHKLKHLRTKYANLTIVERKQYIQNVSEARKRKRIPKDSTSKENANLVHPKRNWYSTLSDQEKKEYAKHVNSLRKKKQHMVASTSSALNQRKHKPERKWLLKAQMILCQPEGT